MKAHTFGAVLTSLAIASTIFLSANGGVSALTYQTEVDVEFTFEPTISLNISSGSLDISELSPSTSGDSNIITIAASSNATYGYTLSATVGTNSTNSNLTNTSNSNYVFTNLSTTAGSASSLSNIPENYWGYSYSENNGTTWVSGDTGSTVTGYAGLPLDNNSIASERGKGGVVLIDTNSLSENSSSIQFKIGARASAVQPAGTYTNVINFYTVAKPKPAATIANASNMQEVEACDSTVPVNTTYTLTDTRDNQEYTVAKLNDGKCWMTKNLNIAGGTLLSSDTTDFDSTYSLPTDQGWQSDGRLPTSKTTGFSTVNYAYVYNSNSTNCNGTNGCYSYYSWDAATLGSGRSLATDNVDAPYSICPKGWRLPKARYLRTTTPDKTPLSDESDSFILATNYGMISTRWSESTSQFDRGAGPGTTGNFQRAGVYESSTMYYKNEKGYYWTSTSFTSSGVTSALTLEFSSSDVDSAAGWNRKIGSSVRCVFGD